MGTERLVIRRHRPWRTFLAALLLLGVAAGGGYAAYREGRDAMRGLYLATSAERDRLQERAEELESTNAVLRERVAVLERASQIEREAYAELDAHLKGLQQEVLELKEEVAFYRNVVSAGDAGALDIQSFDVRRDGGERDYVYRLVLTGAVKSDTVMSGTVDLSIAGQQQGRARRLSLAELTDGSVPDLSFQLKHFQRIKGRLTLPEGFVPQQVSVEVNTSGADPATVEKTFDWPLPLG